MSPTLTRLLAPRGGGALSSGYILAWASGLTGGGEKELLLPLTTPARHRTFLKSTQVPYLEEEALLQATPSPQ